MKKTAIIIQELKIYGESKLNDYEIVETRRLNQGFTGKYRLIGRGFDFIDLPGRGGRTTIEAAKKFIARR